MVKCEVIEGMMQQKYRMRISIKMKNESLHAYIMSVGA